MPQDVNDHQEENALPVRQEGSTERTQGQWFTTPPIIERLFNNFPLRTYAPNEPPQRTATERSHHSLYVFTTCEAARLGSPSYNPSCLKWQVNQNAIFNYTLRSFIANSSCSLLRPILSFWRSNFQPSFPTIMHRLRALYRS